MKTLMMAAAAALTIGAVGPATAQDADKAAKTPANWSYELKKGQRVPKVARVVHADGSWTEEIVRGNCKVTRTGRDGEVREVHSC